jgi:hypothetical protein
LSSLNVFNGGEEVGKWCGRVNIVQILCTHVFKWKNDTCWNYSRNGEGQWRRMIEWGKFKYDIWYIKNFCECTPTQHNKKSKMKKGSVILYPCKWCMKILVGPSSHKYLLLSVFNLVLPVGMRSFLFVPCIKLSMCFLAYSIFRWVCSIPLPICVD